jgi:hypothetical protein
MVPSFLKMVENNGALFASKLRDRLEATPAGFPSDPVVICPDEEGSIAFTSYLRFVLGVTVIRIPRPVIYQCAEADADLPEIEKRWENQKPKWYLTMISLTVADIIVMDEFNFSGKTQRGLSRLARHFGRDVSYFSLADFNPEDSRKLGGPAYCLYDFQLFAGKGIGRTRR